MKQLVLLVFVLMGFVLAESNKEKIINLLPPGVELNFFEDSELEDFYAVNVANNQIIYISKDFKYVFAGELIRFNNSTPESLNDLYKQKYVLSQLDKINEDEAIKFISKSESKVIRVFTDVKCAYCRIFHSEVQSYLDEGISVFYYAFPRDGNLSDSYDDMNNAWCSRDKNESLTRLKLGEKIDDSKCDSPVERHFLTGRLIGVTGTPTIILDDGSMLTGYIPSEGLIKIIKNG